MKLYRNREWLEEQTKNKNFTEVAEESGYSYKVIRGWAKKYGIKPAKKSRVFKKPKYEVINETLRETICSLYSNDVLRKDIAKQLNIDVHYVKKVLELRGIPLKTRSEIKAILDKDRKCSVHNVNQHYFKTWSSNMSYVLGFLSADGHIGDHSLVVNLAERDVDVLHTIAKELEYNGNIRYYQATCNNKEYPSVNLSIHSKDIVQDLTSLGFTSNKGATITIPSDIPSEYVIDFIRGFFDGDGSVGGNYANMKSRRISLRVRIFSASFKILEQIRIHLNKEFDMTLINISKSKHKDFYHLYYSTNDSLKMYSAMYYNDNVLHLKRKKDSFDTLIDERKMVSDEQYRI